MTHIWITAKGRRFKATLADTEAARQFAKELPAVYDMQELNGNEKYIRTTTTFSRAEESLPARIYAGDLAVYSGSYVVVFYKDHPNNVYSYVRLGSVDDASGLAEALGRGNATVSFELQ